MAHATASPTNDTDLGVSIRAALASLSFGAGAIHLAMATSHAGEWLAEGVVFAIAGWLQLGLALAFAVRPSKAALITACGANLLFVAAWAWTRTVGMPFGPEQGNVHVTGFVDVTAAVFEMAIVVLSALALATPTTAPGTSRVSRAACVAIPLCVLALATTAIVSPSARGHAHGGDEGATGTHDHATPEADEAATEAAADDGHDHGVETLGTGSVSDEPADSHADGHTHEESSATALGEHAQQTDGAQDVATDSAAGDTHAHPDVATEATPVDDKGLSLLENGHMAHVYGPDQSLDAFTRAALAHQLALTRSIAERFPTLGDARTAGSRAAGAFGPGTGIHMSLPTTGMPDIPPPDPAAPWIPGTLTDAEVLRPANLLYDGATDDAPLAGFMYYSTSPVEPEGFAGPNDHWHTHGALCLNLAGEDGIEVLHPAEKTAESCQSIDGVFIEQTTFMVHVWTIPGYESNRGVFSDINPAIACPDGTYYTVPEADTEQYQLSKCLSSPA